MGGGQHVEALGWTLTPLHTFGIAEMGTQGHLLSKFTYWASLWGRGTGRRKTYGDWKWGAGSMSHTENVESDVKNK